MLSRASAAGVLGWGFVAGEVRGRVVDGQVVVIEPTGPDTLVVLNVGGYEITAHLEPDFDLRPGDRAEFKLDLTNLVLFDPSTEKLIA